MTPDQLFSIASNIPLPGWLLLLLVPRWKYTMPVVRGVCVVLLAAFYTYLIVAHFGDGEGGFGSLAQVAKLFENRWALLAGWVHYLAFDLFVGAWMTEDAQRRGLSHWFVVPCLPLTLMFGPCGLLLYLLLRLLASRSTRPAAPADVAAASAAAAAA